MSTPPLSSSLVLTSGKKLTQWLTHDGRDWIYVGKAVLAALLALGIALRLNLPQPRTAMTTVFIVMQAQSGMVLAKSVFRFVGTLVGLATMLLFISLFSQEPLLYLAAVTTWLAICTFGAAHYRDFRSYGFLLSGYTAVLVGIPAAQNAPDAFMTATTRLAEITLGILCAGAVSALVFPQLASGKIEESTRRRLIDFIAYVAKVLAGTVDRRYVEKVNAQFVMEIVRSEAVRTAAALENPDMRKRSNRYARCNAEFMGMATRMHALHRMMESLRSGGSLDVVAAVEPLFGEAALLLEKTSGHFLTPDSVANAASQISTFRSVIADRIAIARASLSPVSAVTQLEFDTVAELLSRFINDFDAYANTFASLAALSHERERWAGHYSPKTNKISAGIASFRCALLMLLLSVFWISSGWPSGGMAVLNAGAICALASTSARPRQMGFEMAAGTTLSAIVGFVVMFDIYPRVDGFYGLCLALAPFLAFGAWMTTRPRFAGYGVGYCIYFCFLAGPDNVIKYDPSTYINNALATIISMFAVWALFAVVFPTTGRWLPRLLLTELGRQVNHACKGRLLHVSTRFESQTRDLFSQIGGIAYARPEFQQEASDTLFLVLEVGHAIIDVRTELAKLTLAPGAAVYDVVARSVDVFVDAVGVLFVRHPLPNARPALRLAQSAMDQITIMLRTLPAKHEHYHSLKRTLTQIHFIRTALLARSLDSSR